MWQLLCLERKMKRRLGESCRDEEVAWEPSLWDHRPSQRGCLASQGFRVRFEDAGTPPFVHTPPAGVLVNVPSLSSSHRPTSSLPHPSPVGARPSHAPALSWVPQTRLTGAPAGAGGHSSVFTSPSHAGICRDRRFFLESTLCPKRATRRSPRCSGKQEKTFLSWISVLDTFNSLWEVSVTLTASFHTYIYMYVCNFQISVHSCGFCPAFQSPRNPAACQVFHLLVSYRSFKPVQQGALTVLKLKKSERGACCQNYSSRSLVQGVSLLPDKCTHTQSFIYNLGAHVPPDMLSWLP